MLYLSSGRTFFISEPVKNWSVFVESSGTELQISADASGRCYTPAVITAVNTLISYLNMTVEKAQIYSYTNRARNKQL